MIVRGYIMLSKEGQQDQLRGILEELNGALAGLDGFRGTETLHDKNNPRRFIFIEKWADEAAHKAAGTSLPKELMGRLMGALDGPFDGSYYDSHVRAG